MTEKREYEKYEGLIVRPFRILEPLESFLLAEGKTTKRLQSGFSFFYRGPVQLSAFNIVRSFQGIRCRALHRALQRAHRQIATALTFSPEPSHQGSKSL